MVPRSAATLDPVPEAFDQEATVVRSDAQAKEEVPDPDALDLVAILDQDALVATATLDLGALDARLQ